MKPTGTLLAVLLLAGLAPTGRLSAADPWQPAPGPLMTRWAKDVSPTNALPEYPRPQMVRERWQNLNGLWDYAITAKADERPPAAYDGKILVPYPVESALSGVMRALQSEQRFWYRRTFDVPSAWLDGRIKLHFGAVNWISEVWIDGKSIGRHLGGYDGFTFDLNLKNILTKAGPHEIVVGVNNPVDKGWQARGKQVLKPGGANYTASSGIWQTVWLEPVPKSAVDNLTLVPDLTAGSLAITVDGRLVPTAPLKVVATAYDGANPVASVEGVIGSEFALPYVTDNLVKFYKATLAWTSTHLTLAIPNPKAWSPVSPFLYNLKIELKDASGQVVDTVTSYFGVRDVALVKDEKGRQRIFINGQPVVLLGALDQGYWPDGIYTAPTDAALRFDLEAAKRLGFNALRKHVKAEPARWYYWADKLGVLVMQDMPSSSSGDPYTDLPSSPEASEQLWSEFQQIISERINHPSIIIWCPFNEGWGQHDTRRFAASVKQLDPSRLVSEASGFPWHGGGDIADQHGGWAGAHNLQAGLNTETCGFGLTVPGHDWPGKHWSTGTYDPATSKQTTGKYEQLYPLDAASRKWYTDELVKFYGDNVRDGSRIGTSGNFKCQLIDVETEANGLLSYDRAVWKVDPDAIRNATHPGASDVRWSNPLPFQYTEGQTAPRSEVRDPCIIREDDTYYLIFTMHPFRNREEKFLNEPNQGGSPGIALYSSKDLKSWKFENWLVKASELTESCPHKNRFWAPEIHKIGGKFYLIFTADNWLKNEYNPAGTWGTAGYAFVGVADKITGPYEHITWLRGAGCDTTLFGDTDGKTYAFISRGNIDVQEIDLNTMKLVGQPKRILTADNSDIGVPAKPDYLEGPWVEKIGARYCLFYAEIYKDKKFPAWLGYWTGVAYADSPLGPWKKDPRGKLFLGGHLAVFDGPDHRKWFSYRGESNDAAHGKLCIAPVNLE
ncbi:MAG: family 43 glycosylhydrolase [Verrucomicrobiota bacterium]